MTTGTRTTIEFQRVVGTDDATGDAILETVNADVSVDGESVAIDFPAPGRWACDQTELRAAIAH